MDDVDEDRLEALALQFDLAAETRYEKRGVSWYCWLTAAGDRYKFPITGALNMRTKQMAFDDAMDSLMEMVRQHYGDIQQGPE